MLPPAATAVCRAAKVQEAGVPLPTTRAGEAVSVIVGGVQTAARTEGQSKAKLSS